MVDIRKNISDKNIGYVPTMGGIHDGHLSLMKKAQSECVKVVVSVFLNPFQFNNSDDLSSYPSNIERDLGLLKHQGIDYVFLPQTDEIYPDRYKYKVMESSLSRKYCGQYRPGHFDGVLTVILKLFHIICPHRAYFGEKDYQQLILIQEMVESLFLPVHIVPCAIVRDQDGLAMSSRNQLLDRASRKKASVFYKILSESSTNEVAREELEGLGFQVEYVETLNNRRLGAIKLKGVRLIDNVKI